MPTKVPPWVWAKKKKQSAGSTNKPKERKTRFSRWFITCNANKKTSQISEVELKKRYQMCAMLLQQSRIKPYVYILNKEDTASTVRRVSTFSADFTAAIVTFIE